MTGIKYEDYQALILNRVRAWRLKLPGMEYDDLVGEGNLAFCQALKTYNPQKSKFSTYLWNTLQMHFGNLMTVQTVHRKDWHRASNAARRHDGFEPCSLPDQEARIVFLDGLRKSRKINGDEHALIGIVMSQPESFAQDLVASGNPRTTKRSLTRYMREQYGWGYGRAWRAFANLRAALIEI